ncbi:MAG: hypothetical protein ACTHMD_12635, partial [Flavisolibacter sp.]
MQIFKGITVENSTLFVVKLMIKKLVMKEDEKRRDTAHNEAPPAQGSSRDNNARSDADTKRA